MSDNQSFICETCGERHDGLPLDFGFRLPDDVHRLGYIEEYLRTRNNADLCALDESRFFLGGILPLPFQEGNEEFRWGVWVEVSREHHNRYVSAFEEDDLGTPRLSGTIANEIPGYGSTVGLAVEVQLQEASARPAVYVIDSSHALTHEQRDGISRKRHHDLLENTGFFREKDDAGLGSQLGRS